MSKNITSYKFSNFPNFFSFNIEFEENEVDILNAKPRKSKIFFYFFQWFLKLSHVANDFQPSG